MPNDQNENLRQKMVVSFETIVFELTSMTPPTEQGVVHKLRWQEEAGTLRFLLYVLVLLYVLFDFFFLIESIISTGRSQ